MIAVAEAIPFPELTQGSHERLYALKGEVVQRGVRAVLGLEMPIFPKRRFQHGAADGGAGGAALPVRRGALPAALRGVASGDGVSGVASSDARIRALRPAKPFVDPGRAHGFLVEEERRPGGAVEHALTAFLSGAECPFTCAFCDLWRYTIDGPTPEGALTRQVKAVLDEAGATHPHLDRLKLYNASNWFDRRAVPSRDSGDIAALASSFAGVTVESHANTVGAATLDFAGRLTGRLEVAMGLETIHPVAAAQLNKRLDLSTFDRAAGIPRRARDRPAGLRPPRRAARAGGGVGGVGGAERGVCGGAGGGGGVDHPGARRQRGVGAAGGDGGVRRADASRAGGRRSTGAWRWRRRW